MTAVTRPTIDAALSAMAESLESMAFVSLAPIDGPPPPLGSDAVAVRLAFDGPCRGELAIVAPRALGRLLVGNVAGGAGCADAAADEAIGEVVNVTCGRMLREFGGGRFAMGLPWAAPVSADDGWVLLPMGPGMEPAEQVVVDAEGIPVGLRLSVGP